MGTSGRIVSSFNVGGVRLENYSLSLYNSRLFRLVEPIEIEPLVRLVLLRTENPDTFDCVNIILKLRVKKILV